MAKKTISISLSQEEMKLLEKRAKQNLLSARELAEDIIRRSMLSYHGGKSKGVPKIDDTLINVFSRERKGRRAQKR